MFTYPFPNNTFQHFLRLIKEMFTTTSSACMKSIDAEIKLLHHPLDAALAHFNPNSHLPGHEKANADQIALFNCECKLLDLLRLVYEYRVLTNENLNTEGVVTLKTYEQHRKALAALFDDPSPHPVANALLRFAACLAEALHIVTPDMDQKKIATIVSSGMMVPTILCTFQSNPERAPISVANIPKNLVKDLYSRPIYVRDDGYKPESQIEKIAYDMVEITIKNLLTVRSHLSSLLDSDVNVSEFSQSQLQQSRSDCVVRIDSVLSLVNLSLDKNYQKQHKQHYGSYKFNAEIVIQKIPDLKNRTPVISGYVLSTNQLVAAADLLWRYFGVAEAMTQTWLMLEDKNEHKEKIRLSAVQLLENIDFDSYAILLKIPCGLWKSSNNHYEISNTLNQVRCLYHVVESYLIMLKKSDKDFSKVLTTEEILVEDLDFNLLGKTSIFAGLSTFYHSIFKYQFRLSKSDPIKRAASFDNLLAAIKCIVGLRKKMKETWYILNHDIHARQLIVDLYLTGLYYCRTSKELALFQTDDILSEVSVLFKDDSHVLMFLLTEVRRHPVLQGQVASKVDFTQLPVELLIKCFHLFKKHLKFNKDENLFLITSENNQRFNTKLGGFYYRTITTITKYLIEHGDEALRAEAKSAYDQLHAYTQHCVRSSMSLATQLLFNATSYRPPPFYTADEIDRRQRNREASFSNGKSVSVVKTIKKNKSKKKTGKPQKKASTVVDVGRQVNDNVKKVESVPKEPSELFHQHYNSLFSRKVDQHSAALLGCAQTLSLMAVDKAHSLVEQLEINAERVLKQAKTYMPDDKYTALEKEYHRLMATWRQQPEVPPVQIPPIAKEVVQLPLLIPKKSVVKQKTVDKPDTKQTKDRFFNRPIVKHEAVRNVEISYIPPRPAVIIPPPDCYASIRKKISRAIIPIPIQKSVMQFLRLHRTDPVIHGGRLFYALLGIDDNKRGDLDVLCHVKSRAELRALLEKNKEKFSIADFRETKKLTTEILIIIFNYDAVKDQVRNHADYQLEIACIPDTGNRLNSLVTHCEKFGLYCPVYDPFTATLLDTSNQVEEMLEKTSLPFQPAAGDPCVYLRENPERMLDIFKRKAHCESHGVSLNIDQYENPIVSASVYLNRPVVKFSMEKFKRLFHQGYAKIVFDLLVKYKCLKPLFSNLGNKFYDYFSLLCQLHDAEIKSLDLNTMSAVAFDDLQAKFLANLFLGNFLAVYNVADQQQFYIDCVEYLSSFSFDMKYDAVIFQKIQDIWWEVIVDKSNAMLDYDNRKCKPNF